MGFSKVVGVGFCCLKDMETKSVLWCFVAKIHLELLLADDMATHTLWGLLNHLYFMYELTYTKKKCIR